MAPSSMLLPVSFNARRHSGRAWRSNCGWIFMVKVTDARASTFSGSERRFDDAALDAQRCTRRRRRKRARDVGDEARDFVHRGEALDQRSGPHLLEKFLLE